jgi:hypothetical protein
MIHIRGLRAKGARVGREHLDRVAAYAAILVSGFFGIASYGKLAPDARSTAFGDALNYLRMSEETFAPVDHPFALRLLTPWLVQQLSGLTGVNPDVVWLTLTLTATIAALVVVYEWMRGPLQVSPPISLFATLLLSVTYYYTSYNYGNFWLVDPLNNLACAFVLLFAFQGRLALFTATMLIGFVNKETVLLLAPLYPLLAWGRSGRLRDRAVVLGVAANLVVGAGYLAFRNWAQAQIGDNGSHLGEGVAAVARAVLSSRPGAEHLAVFGIFGFLWISWVLGLRQEYRRFGMRSGQLLASLFIAACCLVGRTQATDTERVFILLAPLVVGVAATVFDTWRGEVARLWMWVLGVMYAALQFSWVTGQTAVFVSLSAVVGFAYLQSQQSAGVKVAAHQSVGNDLALVGARH